jgi:thiamine-phosphate pyrophosphorylase
VKSLSECWLYAFVDTICLRGRAPQTVAQQLCDGGADLIQLRAKQSPIDEVRRMAETILPVTRRAGVPLVINDHLSVAQELGTEFCHLGQEDFFDAGYTQISQLLAPTTLHAPRNRRVGIGLSTHGEEQAKRALSAGPDYIAVGPLYSTATKPGAKPIAPDYLRWAAENVKVPWFAIGGINLEKLDQVLAAGVQRICVVSAILNAEDPAAACRKFKQRLGPLATKHPPAKFCL